MGGGGGAGSVGAKVAPSPSEREGKECGYRRCWPAGCVGVGRMKFFSECFRFLSERGSPAERKVCWSLEFWRVQRQCLRVVPV